MPDYDNTNSGALFKNKDKDKAHPNWADYQGSVNVEGVEYWLSAWIKESEKVGKFMSLSLKPKEEQREKPKSKAKDDSDDIPF